MEAEDAWMEGSSPLCSAMGDKNALRWIKTSTWGGGASKGVEVGNRIMCTAKKSFRSCGCENKTSFYKTVFKQDPSTTENLFSYDSDIKVCRSPVRSWFRSEVPAVSWGQFPPGWSDLDVFELGGLGSGPVELISVCWSRTLSIFQVQIPLVSGSSNWQRFIFH